MSRNRFQLIQRYLHFSDSNAAGTNEDHFYKFHTILDIFVNNFRTNYIPDREISLDEGMLGWRGRLQFRVYNPSKIIKYGILVQTVCGSSTGYIRNLQIYDGKCGTLTETVGFVLGKCGTLTEMVGFLLSKCGTLTETVGFLLGKCGTLTETVGFYSVNAEL